MAVARVEAQDLVHHALADPVEAGERNECVRLHGVGLVGARDAVRDRIDPEELSAVFEHPDGPVPGGNGPVDVGDPTQCDALHDATT
jgi:hypothetical protein